MTATAYKCDLCGYVHNGASPPDACPVCGAAAALLHPNETETTATVTDGIQKVVILGGGSRMVAVEENGHYLGLCCHDGQVIGAVLYGDMNQMGPLHEALEQGLQIPEWGELSQHFPELVQHYV